MPTKEEILKVHEDKYDVFLEDGSDYGINPIYGAMEEYAKQEAKEFAIVFKSLIKSKDDKWDLIWDRYQKSKLKK